MSYPNPFERLVEPALIAQADQAALVTTPASPNEDLRRRNPFPPREENRSGDYDQNDNGMDGASLHPTEAINDNSPQYFGRTPTFLDTPRPLNSRDVCSFIVNKMVGTGIYTTPPVVMLLTRSKGEALGLWFVGFAYTLIRYALAKICHNFSVPLLTRII